MRQPRLIRQQVMAEPRDKLADPATVRDFYTGACAAAQAADPGTPCMVGAGPYYKLWRFTRDIVLPDNRHVSAPLTSRRGLTPRRSDVIYTFDYFQPADYCFQSHVDSPGGIPTYPGRYDCGALAGQQWAAGAPPYNTTRPVCPLGANHSVPFDADWHNSTLSGWAVALRTEASVPIFLNQWKVNYGISATAGRQRYMSDLARTLQQLNIGWAWWVWRGGGDPKGGSSGFVWGTGAAAGHDAAGLAAVVPFLA